MSRSTRARAAEIVREYGPFPGLDHVHGVTYDGHIVWFAAGDTLNAFDPANGKMLRSIDVAAHAGTAFDGEHLFQIAEDRIQKIDPKTGRVIATIPAPGGGGDSGLAWAEGTLWVGHYRDRKIHQVDPDTGEDPAHDRIQPFRHRRHLGGWRALARHVGRGRERSSASRSADGRGPSSGSRCRQACHVSGLESDGGDQFFCGGGRSGKVRAVRRPKRRSGAQR
jgi:hypothetical protein